LSAKKFYFTFEKRGMVDYERWTVKALDRGFGEQEGRA